VGDFILSLLRLYLCFFRTFIYRFLHTWGLGGNLHFSDRYFFLFHPTLLYEFIYVTDFVLWVILEVTHSVTGTQCVRCDCVSLQFFWTNFLTWEQKFTGRWLVFFDSVFLWIHHTATPLIIFLTQPNSHQINQRHNTHNIPFN